LKKRRRWLWGLGGIGLAAATFVWWVPWEFDVFPRDYPSLARNLDAEAFLRDCRQTVMVVTAHPDDSEFYVASTLRALADQGARITLVVATDGDKGYYPFGEDVAANRRIRQREQRQATAAWGGIDTIFLGFPDGRLADTEALVRAISREMDRLEPAVILGFDGAYPVRLSHGDHRAVGRATELAAGRRQFQDRLYRFQTGAPNVFIDTSARWDFKREAVMVHMSQFGEKRDFILGMIRGLNEEAGRRAGVPLAEQFRAR
jgi:LmbE family N-acetylglucosaminyl deacetylase